jgi:hypothetical protein
MKSAYTLTKKSTKEEILVVLIETRSSVKKDYLVYERILMDKSLPDFRRESCEAECERLLNLIQNIDVFTGQEDL